MLGVRLDKELERRLDLLAKQRGTTRSEIVREALRQYLWGERFLEEARRQSTLVSADEAEREAGEVAYHLADFGEES